MYGFNSKLATIEERISMLKSESKENTQSKQRDKRIKNIGEDKLNW